MNGLVVLLIFGMGYLAGVLSCKWGDASPKQPDDIQRKFDRWDGTR